MNKALTLVVGVALLVSMISFAYADDLPIDGPFLEVDGAVSVVQDGEIPLPPGSDILTPEDEAVLVEDDTPAPETPAPQPQAAGGGGGGQCKSNWICSDWTDCSSGLQTRSCNKQNPSCTAIGVRPAESQTCTVPAENLAPQTGAATAETTVGEEGTLGQAPITGAVTGTGNSRNFWIAGVFILGVAVAGVLIWQRRKVKVSN